MKKLQNIFVNLVALILIFIGGFGFFEALMKMGNRVYEIDLKKGSMTYEEVVVPVSHNPGIIALASAIIIFAGSQLLQRPKE